MREDALVWPLCRFCFIAVVLSARERGGRDESLPGMKVCWPPKLSRSTVHGVVYRCHCIPVSVYQLLCNVREGCKVLLFCLSGGTQALQLPYAFTFKGWTLSVGRSRSSSSDHSHVFMFDDCFFFIYLLNLLYPKPKHRCWVNRPTFSPILLSVLKICPRIAFVLHTFGSSASRTICKNKLWTQKKDLKGFQIVTVYSLFVCLF